VAPYNGGTTIESYNVQWSEDGVEFTDLFSSTTIYLDLSYKILAT